MSRRVEGVYTTIDEALAAVEHLRAQGYGASAITLVANAEVRSALPYAGGANVTPETNGTDERGEDTRSFWEKVKDAFTWGDQEDSSLRIDSGYEAAVEAPGAYQEEIERGNIVILVEEAAPATDRSATLEDTVRDITEGRDETLELREERLDIDLQEVKTGEIRITKRVVEETETVEVPVTYEEITIERRPVTERRVIEGNAEIIETEDEIIIPVIEEQVIVDKETRVVEEVEVQKEAIVETERVSETLQREELDVDTTGSVQVEETRILSDRDRHQMDQDRNG